MTASRGTLAYRRLRAPRKHGETLVDPPWESVPGLLAENQSLLRSWNLDLQGRSFLDLSRQARRELLAAAATHTAAYRSLPSTASADSGSPVLLTGHQPELYHPGVWFKNFALSSLARNLGASAINLLIDNDTVRGTSIRVPSCATEVPRVARIAIDRPSGAIPFEERSILDDVMFASFESRVKQELGSLVQHPFIEELWPLAREALKGTRNLGRVLSQARHRLEERWGLTTCELSLSEICGGEPFLWFLVHILAQLPVFQRAYNTCLAEYRKVHGIRSRTHPVPALSCEAEWMEAPFWIWTAEDPERRRLFLRPRQREMELSDLRSLRAVLSLHADGSGEKAVAELQDLSANGVRIRPRALLTTMFARLFLSDLFLHGIGGAKYDQLTDAIVQCFFHRSPPGFLVLTATAKLPVAQCLNQPETSAEELRQIRVRLRELRYNPQRYVASTDETEALADRKAHWITCDASHIDPRHRHREIERVNAALQPLVQPLRESLLAQRNRCLAEAQRGKLLGSREFSFCLFPRESLQFLLLDICEKDYKLNET